MRVLFAAILGVVLGVLLAIAAKKEITIFMYNEYQPSLLLAPYMTNTGNLKAIRTMG